MDQGVHQLLMDKLDMNNKKDRILSSKVLNKPF